MVDFVKIAGKEHPISICWGAICEYCELVGIDKLSDLGRLMEASPLQICQFLWICLWYGAKADGRQEPEIKPDELLMLVDQVTISDFIKVVGKRLSTPPAEDGEDGDVKKKK